MADFKLTLKAWIHASRLRTLPLAAAGILLGGCIAASESNFETLTFVLALVTTLLLQILSNWANDYGDFSHGVDNAERVGPARTLQSGAISPLSMKKAMTMLTILALLSGLFLLWNALQGKLTLTFAIYLTIGLLAIGSAIKYTVGKHPFGYHGLGDLMVFIFFGLAAVMGTYFLMSAQMNWWVLLPAATVGLLSTAVLNVNNMRDRVNDEASQKRTLAVRMGFAWSKWYHFALLCDSYIYFAIFMIFKKGWFGLAPLTLSYIPLVLHARRIWLVSNEKDFDPELKVVSLSTLFIAITNGLYIWLW